MCARTYMQHFSRQITHFSSFRIDKINPTFPLALTHLKACLGTITCISIIDASLWLVQKFIWANAFRTSIFVYMHMLCVQKMHASLTAATQRACKKQEATNLLYWVVLGWMELVTLAKLAERVHKISFGQPIICFLTLPWMTRIKFALC